jgi:hypothetical protein
MPMVIEPLVPFGYEDDRKEIPMRGRYKQLFGRNKLKLCILDTLRVAPADAAHC